MCENTEPNLTEAAITGPILTGPATLELTMIIPVYNAEAHIEALVSALSCQSCKSFQAVFVNDASTDGSLGCLEKSCAGAPFGYKIVNLKQNGGPGNARNVGMRSVSTPYFSFMDADDGLSERYVECLLKTAKRENADIVIASGLKQWPDGRTCPHYDLGLYEGFLNDSAALACLCDCAPWGKIFKTFLWNEKETAFPTNIRCEDLASVPVLFYKAKRVAVAPEAVYCYRQTEHSRSRSGGKHYKDIFTATSILASRLEDFQIAEFQFVTHVGYGVVMSAVLCGAKKQEVLKYADFLREKYPRGVHNKYFKYVAFPKRLFIRCTYFRAYWLLKLMVKLGKR